MMVDGKYSITMQTPIGPVRGMITLVTNGEKLSGVLEAMGGRHEFSGGSVQGEECVFSSEVRTTFGKIHLNVKGNVQGDVFRATAHTQMGVITAMGRRMQPGGNRKNV
ncbi:hypothetical protein [Anaeromassilibacillus senegalensis]|uniref:hypothetical protein n=1 Tax=Anaeromassilibacillus senegalensis TaxID=1673717 RepID=UPI001A9A4821|nr:hypothetical protein [Anaeromassilibacillus senegalensis]